MNERDFDRRLTAWLDEGPASVSDRVIEGALAQVPTTPQRGAGLAPLRSLIMRLQPAAPILGVAAVAVVAALFYFAFWQPRVGGPEVSPTPSPEGTHIRGSFTATTFEVPLSFQLAAAPSAEGWYVVERPSLLRVSAEPGAGSYLALLPLDQTLVAASGGQADASGTPGDWFADVPGFTIEPMTRFDVEGLRTWNVAGEEVQIYRLTVDPATAGDLQVVTTQDGEELRADSDAPSTWLLGVVPHEADDLLVAFAEGDTAEELNIGGSVFGMIESIEFR